MAVTIGNSSNGGWSDLTPRRDTDTTTYPTWASQFGTGYNGNGTRFMFFASTAHGGNDGNAGTLASPKRNPILSEVLVGIRSGSPDWCCLHNGDEFPLSLYFMNSQPGDVFDAASYMQVITGYDPLASNNPPLFNPGIVGGVPLPIFALAAGAQEAHWAQGGGGKGFCIGGVDHINRYGDPRDPLFSGPTGAAAVTIRNTAGNHSCLIEDCGFYFFSTGVDFNEASLQRRDSLIIRRSRFRKSAGNNLGGHPGIMLEDNLIEGSTWQPYSTCTFSGTTVTVPADPPGNTKRVKFYKGWSGGVQGVLPTNVIEDETYFARDVSGNTFKISAEPSGSAITFTGSPSGTLRWTTDATTVRPGTLHNYYLGGLEYYGYQVPGVAVGYTIRNNIVANDAANAQMRAGGTLFNNLFLQNDISNVIGAPIAGEENLQSYNVNLAGGDCLICMNATYYFDSYHEAPIDYDHNIVAHGRIKEGTGFGYTLAMTGGTLSNNIQYRAPPNFTSANLKNGSLLTVSIHDAGSGGDGRMACFEGGYPDVTHDGKSSVANIVAGTGGTNGTHTNIFFTKDGGSSYPGLRGNVTVSGGGVTAVELTDGGALNYTAGDTFTELHANDDRMPNGWSFQLYPFVVELRENGTSWTTEQGTGAQVSAIVMGPSNVDNGYIPRWVLTDNGEINAPWTCDTNSGSATTGASLKLVAGGTDYSSGQVVKPYALVSGPPGATLADFPTGLELTVGPYPDIVFNDGGLAVTSGSKPGSGGGVFMFFQTVAGVTTPTSVIVAFTEVDSNPAGLGYVPDSTGAYAVENFAGMTGVTVNVLTVSENFDAGNNFWLGAAGATPDASWPYPNRARIDSGAHGVGYYESIGAPGGFALTNDGFINAVDQYQRKGTWRDDLMAESANSFVRGGFNMADPGGDPPVDTGWFTMRTTVNLRGV